MGTGINFAGWLIRQVTGDGVVVSDTFRRGIASSAIASDIEFHDERLNVDRDSIRQLLWLMSFGDVSPKLAENERDDCTSLKKCLRVEDGWGALYFAKRISQINVKDEAVVGALESASRILKSSISENSSVPRTPPSRGTDRDVGTRPSGRTCFRRVICRVDDPGESMFVILRGEVGVCNLEGKGSGGTAEPKHMHRAGEVVGELAAVLKWTWTADLVAMTEKALLSFISEEVDEKLSTADTDAGRDAKRQYDRFILDRVVQHATQVAPEVGGYVVDHRELVSLVQQTDPQRAPHLLERRQAGPRVHMELDYR